MGVEMALWRLDGNKASHVETSSLETERRLEDILEHDISILGIDRLLIIGRQVETAFGGVIDILAMDPEGDIHVIELKRDRTPRDIVAQVLDYGSWVRDLDYEAIQGLHGEYTARNFEEAQRAAFGEVPENINTGHHLVIVASELDASTERIVEYLNESNVPVNAVFFRYMRDGDNEYLGRSWFVDPEENEARTSKKRRPWNRRDFYICFGEDNGPRAWEDARKFGFVAGGGKKWHWQSLGGLKPGHRVFVYIPGTGYVGVGEVVEPVQLVTDFTVDVDGTDTPILRAPGLMASNMAHDADDPERCEHLVRVRWTKAVSRDDAFWEPGLFTNQNTAARLRDVSTVERLEQHFGLTEDGAT